MVTTPDPSEKVCCSIPTRSLLPRDTVLPRKTAISWTELFSREAQGSSFGGHILRCRSSPETLLGMKGRTLPPVQTRNEGGLGEGQASPWWLAKSPMLRVLGCSQGSAWSHTKTGASEVHVDRDFTRDQRAACTQIQPRTAGDGYVRCELRR